MTTAALWKLGELESRVLKRVLAQAETRQVLNRVMEKKKWKKQVRPGQWLVETSSRPIHAALGSNW